MNLFTNLGLSADFEPRLSELGITVPTPIQAQAIPIVLTGADFIGIAQTGTGKTLAFGLPTLQMIREAGGPTLVLAPTRELATQIALGLGVFAEPMRIHHALVVGGAGFEAQSRQLRREPMLVIATPGRLMDHVMQGTVRLHHFRRVILDEADRMLDMGFLAVIERILSHLSPVRQTMMFSATMPPEIANLASRFLKNAQRVDVAPSGTPVEQIAQAVYIVESDQRGNLLNDLLADTTGPVLVFARTRHGARKLTKYLHSYGHQAAELHADRTQNQRDAAMSDFRDGRARILVATDIAARGIDVKDIELVVQYDLPDHDEDYIHRIGRTGRAGAEGRAVTFVTPDKIKNLDAMERSLKILIETAQDSPLARPERTVKHMPRQHTGEPKPMKFADRRAGRTRPQPGQPPAADGRGGAQRPTWDKRKRDEQVREAANRTENPDAPKPVPAPAPKSVTRSIPSDRKPYAKQRWERPAPSEEAPRRPDPKSNGPGRPSADRFSKRFDGPTPGKPESGPDRPSDAPKAKRPSNTTPKAFRPKGKPKTGPKKPPTGGFKPPSKHPKRRFDA